MRIKVAWIGKAKESAIQSLSDEYLKRIGRYAQIEGAAVKDEAAILALARGDRGKERHQLILLDSRGKQFSSEDLAAYIGREQIHAVPLLFGIGGSDGFTDEARRGAELILSLGKMTLPHELARVVVLEQIYRAFTILTHHPYHSGHSR